MRKIIFFTLVLCSLAFMCNEPVFYDYTPVFMERSELENAVKLLPPNPIKNPGKIYIKDNYIYINERYKGFHVIDNSDPSTPVNRAFLHIDGCLDIAIKNNLIYADNAVDLIVIAIDPGLNMINVGGRVRNAFPEPSSPDGFWMTRSYEKYRPKNGIIVRWEKNQ